MQSPSGVVICIHTIHQRLEPIGGLAQLFGRSSGKHIRLQRDGEPRHLARCAVANGAHQLQQSRL